MANQNTHVVVVVVLLLFFNRRSKPREKDTFQPLLGFSFSLLGSLNQRWKLFCDGALLYFDNKPTKLKKNKKLLISKYGILQNYYFYACYEKNLIF